MKNTNMWIKGNGEGAKDGEKIECEIKHINKKLREPNQIIRGYFREDGFYFDDVYELSCNWDIIKWISV